MTKNNMIKSEDMHVQPSKYPGGPIRRHVPEVRVSFHTTDKCYQTKGRLLQRDEIRDPTYQLLNVTTTKSLENPAGGFTVTLAGHQWEDRLTPMDLVVVRMGYVGEPLYTVMVGLIDRIQTQRTTQGGKPQVQTTVTGRDFGKIFLKTQLKFYPEIGANNKSAEKFFLTEQGWIKMLGIFSAKEMVEGTPNVILAKIMTAVLPKLNNTKWSVYDESKPVPTPKQVGVTNVVSWDFEATDFFIPFFMTADAFEGSIWNLMERATQKPFTELFIDTYGSSTVPKPSATTSTSNTKPSSIQAASATKTEDKYHTVTSGETLWSIANTYYKNSTKWSTIWTANKDMLIARDKRNASDPGHWIFPGQKLRIPGVSVSTAASTATNNPPTKQEDTYPTKAQSFGMDNGKVILTYRMAPFDASKWDGLVTHTLEAIDTIEEDLARSDEEHYNVFWAGSTINPLGDTNLRAVSPPLLNADDAQRYGLTPLEVEIQGLAIDRAKAKEHKVALENLSNKYTKLLKAWFEKNHLYYNGSILARGNGEYHIGQRLDYIPQDVMCYIEGVTQTFNVFTEWTTSLTVTRGKKKKSKATAPTNATAKADKEVTSPPQTAPKPPTPAPPKPPADKYHTVSSGETLWDIANTYYKNSSAWTRIWEANKAMLIARDKRNATDPGHWIFPGQKLRIPQ